MIEIAVEFPERVPGQGRNGIGMTTTNMAVAYRKKVVLHSVAEQVQWIWLKANENIKYLVDLIKTVSQTYKYTLHFVVHDSLKDKSRFIIFQVFWLQAPTLLPLKIN